MALTIKQKQDFLCKYRINLDAQITVFYILQELAALAQCKSYSLPSHIAWKERLLEAKKEHEDRLALLMRDYLACAVMGEARYGVILYRKNNIEMKKRIHRIRGYAKRESNYVKALSYNPTEIFQVLKDFFKNSDIFPGISTYSEVGGYAWSKACEYGLTYGKIANSIFVDTIVDLQHNSGTIFSKPCLVDFYNTSIINFKARGSLIYLNNTTNYDPKFDVDQRYQSLIEQGFLIEKIHDKLAKRIHNFRYNWRKEFNIWPVVSWNNCPLPTFYKTGIFEPMTRKSKKDTSNVSK